MKLTKKRILLIEIILLSFVLLIGVTYSLYTAEEELVSENIEIADFIFNANKTDAIELPINNLIPGDNKEYTFEVTNNLESSVSDVIVEYQITLTTLHSIPLRYELTYLGLTEEIVLTCNESSERNELGLLTCKSQVMQIKYDEANTDNYRLNVIFPTIYNDISYANLVDYVDLEIDSWQKVG